MTGVFEFWAPDNEQHIAGAKWAPYLVPCECPVCGGALRLADDSAPGPFNFLDDPCHHMMRWSDLKAVSTPKQVGPVRCVQCKLVNPQAEPNLPDGGYLCYNCRN